MTIDKKSLINWVGGKRLLRKKIEKLIQHLYRIKADGIIIQDMGILELDIPPIPIIASTQCNNTTVEKIIFLKKPD